MATEVMMSDSISSILQADAISLRIQGKKKPEIIRELVELLATAGVVRNVETVTAEVIAREELATTGIGGGIAIPHCLSSEVTGTALAFGRRVPGAKFDAVDKQPVQLFFLMVGLPGAHNEHLRYLSKLSRYLHDADTKAGLLAAQSPTEILDVFGRRERR
jgi:mannitol/fructose-specific phosphotransferase system IIA component (Ntr-type)